MTIRDRLEKIRERNQRAREARKYFAAQATEAVRSGATIDEALAVARDATVDEYGADPELWDIVNRLLDALLPVLVKLLEKLLG